MGEGRERKGGRTVGRKERKKGRKWKKGKEEGRKINSINSKLEAK